jgi:hypothetical protein
MNHVIAWRKRTKQTLIEAFGGGCANCGYSNCQAALEFHHLDPETKSSSISQMMTCPRSIEIIYDECEKCIMVCSNCHKELHSGLWEVTEETRRFIRPAKKILKKDIHTVTRPRPTKIEWPTDSQLFDLKKELKSWTAMSKSLGVSDNAIKKRFIRNGIPF